MTRYRRRPALHHLHSIPRKIWRHPNNRGRRLRRLARAVIFQLRKRLEIPPATVPLGKGLRVAADRSAGGVSNLVYFGRYFEYHELHFCERYLRPGDRFIDGGANIGLVSMLASRWVGDEGRVTAFEPAPRAAELLRRNLRINSISNVRAIEAALGEREGQMELIVDMDVSNQLVLEAPEGRRTRSVPVVRLSDAVGSGPFALAKLDLEGAELAALRGAEALLAGGGLPVLLLEALENQLRRLGGSREEVFDLLERHDYRFANYDADSNRLTFQSRPGDRDFFAILAGHEKPVERRLAGG